MQTQFSSPPRGSYISTIMFAVFERYEEFSSPPRGSYISTKLPVLNIAERKSFRPLHGDLIFLQLSTFLYHLLKPVFVPSTGILYFYRNPFNGCMIPCEFSSPPRGSYISTVPELSTEEKMEKVFVPSTGILYFYGYLNYISANYSVFVPSTGILYFYGLYSPSRISIWFSSPPRGSYISTMQMTTK